MPKKNERSIIVFISLLTLAVYSRVLWSGFVNYDDYRFILENSNVFTGLTAQNIKWAFSYNFEYESYLKPLTWLSHMLDVELFGLNPAGHHLVNLLFHTANTTLLFLFLSRTTEKIWQSAVVAILFAIHPLNVEPVAWVADRKDVLSGFFLMLTLCAYSRYAAKPDMRSYIMVFTAFLLGLLAKPMLVSLPVLLLLIDFWPCARHLSPDRKGLSVFNIRSSFLVVLLIEKIPLFTLAIVISIITYRSELKSEYYTLGARSFKALTAYVDYLHKMIWPTKLAVFYPFAYPSNLKIALSIIVFCTISVVAYKSRRSYPHLTIGWLWYVIAITPVIGFIQIGAHVADRYAYLPLIGIFIMISWSAFHLADFYGHRKFLIGIIAMAVLCFSSVTIGQLQHWKNSKTLFSRALEVTKNNWLAHLDYGEALAEENRLDEAIDHFYQALKINPDCDKAHYNLGLAYYKQNRLEQSLTEYGEALKINPANADAHNNVGIIFVNKNRLLEAKDHFESATAISPNFAQAYNNLGIVYGKLNNPEEARRNFEKAVALNPSYVDALYGLGRIDLTRSDFSRAKESFRKIVSIQPEHYEAHLRLGIAYSRLGMKNLALEEYRQLYNSGSPLASRLAIEIEQTNTGKN